LSALSILSRFQALAAGIACAVLLAACGSLPVAPTDEGRFTLRLIGEQKLDHKLHFGGTTVGGLSGIDYDADADLYYLISDDRSQFAPTRFYTARLTIDATHFATVALQTVITLKRPDGSWFPPRGADAEAIRFDPQTRSLWWTSEGERGGPSRLTEPFVRRAALDGSHLDEVPLDPLFHISMEPRGPRDNLVFEGLSLSVDGRSLWVAMEAPLIQDGPMPTMHDGAWARFSRHDRNARGGFGAVQAQFAYPVDPIPSRGAWTAYRAQTGVSEILAIDATHLLVLERAFALGAGWRVRLFEATWSAATDIHSFEALIDDMGRPLPFVPMSKRLVLDFDALGINIDNLEGLCFGPTLSNGHRTLVLVADDNFNPGQSTQFLAFEIVPH
jgi:hypothetical protein